MNGAPTTADAGPDGRGPRLRPDPRAAWTPVLERLAARLEAQRAAIDAVELADATHQGLGAALEALDLEPFTPEVDLPPLPPEFESRARDLLARNQHLVARVERLLARHRPTAVRQRTTPRPSPSRFEFRA